MAQRYILLLKEQCFWGKNYITCHYHRITCLYSTITPCYPATMACYQITGLIPRISLAPHALIARGLWAYRFCPLSDKQAGLPLIARQPLGYRTLSDCTFYFKCVRICPFAHSLTAKIAKWWIVKQLFMGTIHSLTISLSERYKENEWMNSVFAFCIESIFIKYGTLRSFLTSLRVVPTSLCGRSNDTLPP